MTKQSKVEKPTDFRREERDISPEERKIREKGKRIPHPGTVRVTIFPNPRGQRFVNDEDAKGNKNY